MKEKCEYCGVKKFSERSMVEYIFWITELLSDLQTLKHPHSFIVSRLSCLSTVPIDAKLSAPMAGDLHINITPRKAEVGSNLHP